MTDMITLIVVVSLVTIGFIAYTVDGDDTPSLFD